MKNKESVIGFDALYVSLLKCKKGVLWKDSVAGFYLRSGERISGLCDELHRETYQPQKPKHFKITSPKPRDIASIAFRDRIYQRSLNDNVVYPTVTRSFIHDNFACQKGKGTDAARDRLKEFLRKYYRKHGTDGFVAQFDVHGYYPNMDHEKCEKMFQKRLDSWSFERVQANLRFDYDGDKGYNPGSQLVQIAGIAMLDGMDHYIKENLRVHLYIRYMDDFILIHENKAYLEYCKTRIEEYLNGLCFELNEKKTRIFRIKDGIVFLGFDFRITDTGKVLMQIRSENVKRERKKLTRLVRKSKNGELPRSSVDASYQAWRNHASKGDNFKLIGRMDKFYKELWRENGTGKKKHPADCGPDQNRKRRGTGRDKHSEH